MSVRKGAHQGQSMQFDPALSASLYRYRSQLVSCGPGVTRLLLQDPQRVYARFEYIGLPIVGILTLLYGGGGDGNAFGLIVSGAPVELKWIYHGPIIGLDWYVNQPGVGTFDMLVTEICYNGR